VSTHAPDDFVPSDLYDQAYFGGGRPDGYADYASSERVVKVEFRRHLNRLKPHLKHGDRLLELGSAYGYFLDVASRNYEVRGVDVSTHAASVCRVRGHSVFCGPLEEAGFEPGSFQGAVLLDCLEHIPNPMRVLQTLHRLLSSDGVLFLTTGNHDALLSRLMGKRWRLMTPPQHLYFFSSRTLRKMVTTAGFRVLDSRSHWKRVPVGLAAYQVARAGLRIRALERLAHIGIPVNLFDTLQMLAVKK